MRSAPGVAVFAVAVLLLLGACGGHAPAPPSGVSAPEAARGHLLIVGGGPRPAEIMERFIELAGGVGVARIAVVPMASGNPASAGESLVEEMVALGAADAFVLRVDREEAMRPETAGRLDGATGVWFSGGSQTRHTAALKDTPVEIRLHEMLREGVVLGGTSAGAAIMSDLMITGGELRPGGDRPRDEPWITIDRNNVVTDPGFGFIEGAIVDQHFVRRKRHNRLLSLVLENPDQIGVGIDESTAVEVSSDGRWRIIGESVVVIYDARTARITDDDIVGVLGGAGIRMHVLPGGSVFDPRTGDVRGISTLQPTEEPALSTRSSDKVASISATNLN